MSLFHETGSRVRRHRVLIAARDVALRANLARVCGACGYALELAEGPKHAREIIAKHNVSLAIVEPSGFGEVGLELCCELRRAISGLVLIAGSSREIDKLKEAGLGADAYLSRPVDLDSFVTRIRGLLSEREACGWPASSPAMLTFDGFVLDMAGHSLRDPSGQNVPITAAQFALLTMLATRPGQVLSRDQIVEAVIGRKSAAAYDRSVDVLISRLRRKLERTPNAPKLIITVPGIGYKFAGKPQVFTTSELATESGGYDVGSTTKTAAELSIGVVLFDAGDTDKDQVYFLQSLTDDLISALLQSGFAVCRLKSTSDTSATDLQRLAQDCRVHYLVTGSIRRIGERLRIAAQLIHGGTGRHHWAEHYDFSIGGLLPLPDELSRKITMGVCSVLHGRCSGEATPARSIERRRLTVISCEFIGIAKQATVLDPEDFRSLLSSLQRCCVHAIQRFGGKVARFSGDECLAYFGYPHVQEYDAEQAVRAGFALIQGIEHHMPSPDVRLGIATGDLVVGDLIGRGAPEDGGVIGEARNLATALRQTASPNSMVISAVTRRLIGELFACRELDSIDLGGMPGGTSAWEVLRPNRVDNRFEALRGSTLTPPVGREEEMQLLLGQWQRAKNGEMRMVLVTGEPGIGKSRLAAAMRSSLGVEPHTCLSYFCSPHHQDSALYPVIRQLESTAGFGSEDDVDSKLAKLSALLSPAAPRKQYFAVLAELLGLPAQTNADLGKLRPRQKRELIFHSLISQLDWTAQQRPVLMIFEDAHWSDPTSGELLDLIMERLSHRPILLLITFRPEFAAPWSGQPRVTTLTLSRLAHRESTILIRRMVGEDALPNDLVDKIAERSDGVPLFLEELSKIALEASSDSTKAPADRSLLALPIPATLHASLISRLDKLDPAAKEIAQVGAVIGREFSYELVAAVASHPDRETESALERLVASGLASRRGRVPDASFLFKHSLVQDAACSMLGNSRRQQLHARVATVLEERFPEVAERSPVALAHHCTEGGLITRAVSYWRSAGHKSVAQGAMVEAAAQLRKGLDLLARLPVGPERLRQELDFHCALSAALVASEGHGAPQVGEVYARARELAEQLRADDALIPILGGQFSWYLQQGKYAPGREIAEKLLSLADAKEDLTSRLVGHRAMGVCMHQEGAFGPAAEHFEKVLDLYDPDVHQSIATVAGFDLRAAAQRYLAFGQFIRGYADQALSSMEEMMRWSRTLGHPYVMVHALNWTGSFHLLRGDLGAALNPLKELLTLAEQRFPLWLALGQINYGLLLARSGKPDDGLALARKGFDAMIAIRSTWNQTYYRGMLAEICEYAARPGEAIDELQTALSIAGETRERWFEPELRRLTGEWLMRNNPSALADAEAQFQRAIAVAREQNAKTWELCATVSLGRLWCDLGKHAEANAVLQPIYRWFSEGFELPHLRAAAQLLDRLNAKLRLQNQPAGRPDGRRNLHILRR